MTAIVMVKVRCPLGHALPVHVPSGTKVSYYCRTCGREYEATAH